MDMTVGKRMRERLRAKRRQAVVCTADRPLSREELDVMSSQARLFGIRLIVWPVAGRKP